MCVCVCVCVTLMSALTEDHVSHCCGAKELLGGCYCCYVCLSGCYNVATICLLMCSCG